MKRSQNEIQSQLANFEEAQRSKKVLFFGFIGYGVRVVKKCTFFKALLPHMLKPLG